MTHKNWKIALGTIAIASMSGSFTARAVTSTEKTATAKTMMSPYRELASAAYSDFLKKDCTSAAKEARVLEAVWDSTSAPVHASSGTGWEQIDHAMDAFIGPLRSCAATPPDANEVKKTYEAFMARTKGADGPWYGYRQDGGDLPVLQKTSSGLAYWLTKQGAGRQPQPGEVVVARVTGVLGDGTNFPGPSFKGAVQGFSLRPMRGMPPGLLEGLGSLRVGDSAILVVPPALGYGAKGWWKVPGNSTLTYFVEVEDVKSKDMAQFLYDTIEDDGLPTAVNLYRKFQVDSFRDVYVDESAMNQAGYALLEEKRTQEAIQILEWNVEAFPHSANVYDSLADAYARNSQNDLAIANYRKALSIDPAMQSSIKALARLSAN